MRVACIILAFLMSVSIGPVHAQSVIPLWEKGGLHAAYVVPRDDFDRVDVQLIVLSGSYDDPDPSGTAHLTEHLVAFSADAAVLRKPRERDVNARTYNVSTVYTNSGPPKDIEQLMRLSRAVLDTPRLPPGFAESEIDILERETLLRERHSPYRWLRRKALQNLYGSLRGRANNVIDDLPNLSLEKAFEFHRLHYVPSNVTLIVSGKIRPREAAELVAKYFGDTEPSVPPEKHWLADKPNPDLRAVKHVASDKLTNDTLVYAKFIEFEGRTTSIDMQGEFFIAAGILRDRLFKRLYFDDERFLTVDLDMFFARNADMELVVTAQLMPGFPLEDAHDTVVAAIAQLLDETVSEREIKEARQKEAVNAEAAKRRPSGFLRFLSNVASDGFPPISPSVLARTISQTTNEEVVEFMKVVVLPSATSVILAERED